jgi:CRP-like cAMP-binding protein
VVQQSEPPSGWWLLSRGVVGLYLDGRKFHEIDDGNAFGDIPLLYGVKAPYEVRTETPCQLYFVPR